MIALIVVCALVVGALLFLGATSFNEQLGVAAFATHVIAYALYSKGIFAHSIRPNAASWFMWLTGGIVELVTYDALPDSHWSTSALPAACVVGVFAVFILTLIKELRASEKGAVYISPEKGDYYLVVIDLMAGLYWLTGGLPEIANVVAVGSSIVTFWPIWKSTYKDPSNESALPWFIWSGAYGLMFMSVLFGEAGDKVWLSFLPVYYLILHVTTGIIACRKGHAAD